MWLTCSTYTHELVVADGDWTDYAIYRSVARGSTPAQAAMTALEEKHILGAPLVTATRGRSKIFKSVIQRCDEESRHGPHDEQRTACP